MPKFAAYYAVNPSFKSDSVTAEEVRDENIYKKVKEVEADNLDQVFMKMQGEVWSPEGEARELILSLGLHHTSMSVGDVIEDLDNDALYVVAPFGFRML